MKVTCSRWCCKSKLCCWICKVLLQNSVVHTGQFCRDDKILMMKPVYFWTHYKTPIRSQWQAKAIIISNKLLQKYCCLSNNVVYNKCKSRLWAQHSELAQRGCYWASLLEAHAMRRGTDRGWEMLAHSVIQWKDSYLQGGGRKRKQVMWTFCTSGAQ